MGTGGFSPGIKRQGREADHSPPASYEVKTICIYTTTPTYAFMAWCLMLIRGTTLPFTASKLGTVHGQPPAERVWGVPRR
jgi:hypothetical protein